MKTKVLSFVLAAVMLITLLPAAVFAHELYTVETVDCHMVDTNGAEIVSPVPYGTEVTFVPDLPEGQRFCYYLVTLLDESGRTTIDDSVSPKWAVSDNIKVECIYVPPISSQPLYDQLGFEGFEHGIPDSWENKDLDGDSHVWYTWGHNEIPKIPDGQYIAVSSSYLNSEGPLTPENMLATNLIQVETGDLLTFSIISIDCFNPGDKLFVSLIPETGDNILLGSWEAGEKWQDIEVQMPVTGEYRIGFCHKESTDFFMIGLDHIGYWRKKPSVSVLDVFTDVTDNWALEGIQYCYDTGLMSGTTDSTFSPNGDMTRGMFAMVLWNQAGKPEPQGTTPFTDFTKNYYRKAIAWAYENGVVNGVTETTFRPDQPITREQVAAILYRYAKNVLKIDVSASNDITGFPDYSSVSNFAKEPLSWANAEGIITGSKDGGQVRLLPRHTAKRSQCAKILMVFSEPS